MKRELTPWAESSSRALDGGIADDVALRQVLSQDTGAGLLFLGDLIGITLGVFLVVGTVVGAVPGGGSHGNVVAAELRVVQKKRGFGGSGLLENYVGVLDVALGGNLDVGDLAAEAEEVLDLSVTGRTSDVLNLNGAWRSHVGCV